MNWSEDERLPHVWFLIYLKKIERFSSGKQLPNMPLNFKVTIRGNALLVGPGMYTGDQNILVRCGLKV